VNPSLTRVTAPPAPSARLPRVLGAALLGLFATACTEANSPASNKAIHGLAVTVGAAAEAPEPADFVKASRKGQADYLPVGITPPGRTLQPRKGDDVKKLEDELEATRAQHDRLAGRKPPERSGKDSSGKKKDAKAKKKPPADAAQ
jgi:outer membrane biosynthesis protein TonB